MIIISDYEISQELPLLAALCVSVGARIITAFPSPCRPSTHREVWVDTREASLEWWNKQQVKIAATPELLSQYSSVLLNE